MLKFNKYLESPTVKKAIEDYLKGLSDELLKQFYDEAEQTLSHFGELPEDGMIVGAAAFIFSTPRQQLDETNITLLISYIYRARNERRKQNVLRMVRQ